MEPSPSINQTLKICTFASFVGCLILLLLLDQTNKNVSIQLVKNPLANFAPFDINHLNSTTMFINSSDPRPSNSTTYHVENHANVIINPVDVPANGAAKKCNIFDGRWVYKQDEVPRYNSSVCSFLEEKMSCQKNGRPDADYEKWSWEAKDCDIPLFDGVDMLQRLRDKRMIIVGDSLNRNQWESLACLLYSSISPSRVEVNAANPAYKILIAKDYHFTLEFYWSPFLINFDENHKSGRKVLVLDQPSTNSEKWRDADVMVFNTGHWWTHLGKFKAWDLFLYKGKLIEDMPIEQAYEYGMTTWSKWIETNVDPKKTIVFFRSISAEHKGKQWCYNSTQPIMDESYHSFFPNSLIHIIERIINKTSNVKYFNITKSSQYRKDAHPSLYRSPNWKIYEQKYKRLISSYADCSHWCLPGVPDTWNRLLYASLFFDALKNMSSS